MTPEIDLKRAVTFAPNRREPIHNWYWFKEGFSRPLVDFAIDRFSLSLNSLVLDPFCGVGTTNLACKQRGIKSIGFDINPLAVLASKVKTADYNLEELSENVSVAMKWKFRPPEELPKGPYLKRAFSKANLGYTLFYKQKISQIENPAIRDFFLLALIDAATKGSWTTKEGALIRIKRRPVPPVGKLFKYKIKKMLRGLKKNPLPFAPTKIELCDARSLRLENNSIDCVITSPPYLNKLEYSKIYKLELSLFFGLPPGPLKGYVGATANEKHIEHTYWSDMEKVLRELYRVCKPDAKLAVVIGGGCFPHKVVQVDIKTAEIAGSIGFRVNNILVARRSWCTRQRTMKVGRMSESVLLMQKS